MTREMYKGIPRLRDGLNGIYTGLVSIHSVRGWPYFQVREKGVVLKQVAGLSRKTLDFALQIAQRNGLDDYHEDY
jgi:hypothetical protein